MSKVYAIHEWELRPGVTAEEVEQFMSGEGAVLLRSEGAKTYFLKGDRGARTGKFATLTEFESVEERDKAFPVVDISAEDALQGGSEALRSLWGKLFSLVSGIADKASYTDYVVLQTA